jgi:hypothetical protein
MFEWTSTEKKNYGAGVCDSNIIRGLRGQIS